MVKKKKLANIIANNNRNYGLSSISHRFFNVLFAPILKVETIEKVKFNFLLLDSL